VNDISIEINAVYRQSPRLSTPQITSNQDNIQGKMTIIVPPPTADQPTPYGF
jgi:hypothetical protein